MDVSFHGKRALITGAGRGIGRELVKRLVQYGADVVALSRTEEHLISLKAECPNITTVVADVGEWDETKQKVESIGPVDLLVNNAGILQFCTMFGDVTEEEFDRFMSINAKGALNVAQVVANGMKARGTGGSIVNVSSVLAKKAMAGKIVYSMSKAALDQMTRIMAIELGQHQIRVNSVNPGFVWTVTPTTQMLRQSKEKREEFENKVPLKRLSEVSDIVDTIMYLLSDKASMVHGTTVFVDGGHTLA